MSSLAAIDLDPAPILGPEDRAVLDRLRATALLFRAAAPARPEFSGIDLGLWVDHDRHLQVLGSVTSLTCRFMAQLAGWDDLLDLRSSHTQGPRLFDTIRQRVRAAEFPRGCPPALLALLTDNRTARPTAATIAGFARAKWQPDPGTVLFRPELPRATSAHEVLEALAAAEDSGALAGAEGFPRLARAAAATLSVGRP